MNQHTSRALRQATFASLPGATYETNRRRYQRLKRNWTRMPWPLRHDFLRLIRAEAAVAQQKARESA